jgi:ribosome-associated toxin RatA of RatAB toxin-antitoxin module
MMPLRKTHRISIVVAPWFCLACGVATAAPSVDPATAKRLKKWEVISASEKVENQKVMMGKAVGTVADVPEAVLHTVIDVARYRHFLPRIKGSRIVRRRGNQVYAVVESALPWPVRDAWVYVKLVYHRRGGRSYEVKWKMINGTMNQYFGRALIQPWNDDASHTLLTYEVMAEPKTAAPDSAVSKGVRHVAEIFVHRLRMRVRALRKYNKFPADLLARYAR